MKFLLLFIMTLSIWRGVKAEGSDEEVDLLGQLPFSYDGPFKKQFNFDYLLDEPTEDDPHPLVFNNQVNQAQCIIAGGDEDDSGVTTVSANIISEIALEAGEKSSMEHLKCENKNDILSPYLFKCTGFEKKYFNKDKLDSPNFVAYVSPQKKVSHVSNAARYTLKQFDMMAGFPLPWSCVHTKKLDEQNENGYVGYMKEQMEKKLQPKAEEGEGRNPQEIIDEDIEKLNKQKEDTDELIKQYEEKLKEAEEQQKPSKIKHAKEELQKLNLESQQLENAVKSFEKQKKDLEQIFGDIKDHKLYNETYNIQGQHETIDQSMRVFEAEASGNKASILRKTLVLSILLKKMWVLIATQGGIKPYQCPTIQIDTILEEENKFVENSLDFNSTTDNLFFYIKENLFHSRTQEIQHAKRDSINDNVSETYDPNQEIQELSNPTIDDYDPDLYNFRLPNPLETLDYIQVNPKQIGKHCDPSIFKQTSFFNYNIDNSSFGFRSKATMELVQFVYRKEQATEEPDQFNVVVEPEDLNEDVLESRLQKVKDHFKELQGDLGKIKEKMLKYREKGVEKIKQEEEEKGNGEGKQADDVDKQEEKIDFSKGFQRLSGFNYPMLKYVQGMVQYTDRRFIYKVSKKITVNQAIEYLSDRNLLLDAIFDKYKGQKKEANLPWNVDEEVMKIKAIYEFNYTRMFEFLYHQLKFSPLAMPQSVDMVRKSKQVFRELRDFEIYDELNKDFNKLRQETLIQSQQVRAEVFEKPEKDPKIQNVGTIIKKVTNDLYAILKQKEFLVFKSFLEVMEKMMIKYFSPYVLLSECFRPHPKLEMKNKCPVVFRQMLQFIGSHPEVTIDFTQFYNILNGFLNVNPLNMHSYMDNFLNYMYIYAKFELNKLEFFGETGSLEDQIKFMVEQYMSTQHIPNKIHEFTDIPKKYHLAYVYASKLQDIGQNIPEFQSKYIDFLQRLLKVSQIPNNDPAKEGLRQKLIPNNDQYNFEPITTDEDEFMKEDEELLLI